MVAKHLIRPEAGEYAPYYGRYVSLVEATDILQALEFQIKETSALFAGVGEEQADRRYEPGKWSMREVVGHMIDSERIFAYRALRISRNDRAPLPGFEQDDYVREGPYEQCRLSHLAAEFALVRATTLCLFRNLTPDAWLRRGVASDNEVSVRALAWIIAGHELHHVRILRERYLR